METLIKILGVIALIIGIALLLTFPVMWLWNWLMPIIFGLIKLTFWQSFGLSLLCGFLFKSTDTK